MLADANDSEEEGEDDDDEEDEEGMEDARGTRMRIELACGVIGDEDDDNIEGEGTGSAGVPSSTDDDEGSSGTKLLVSPRSCNDGGTEIGRRLFGNTAYVAEDTSVNIVCCCC